MHLSSNLFPFIVLLKLSVALAQTNDTDALFFPADNVGNTQAYVYNKHVQIPLPVTDLVAIRGTSTYEKYVNEIIGTGISRLTVTLNRILTNQGRGSNVAFSPLSISCALALVLLGSNGLTFKEISQLMGLASGITDLDAKSQIVHEQFSRLINTLISSSNSDFGQQINVGTAIFVQSKYPIRSLYKSTAESLYQSTILNVDFQGNPRSAQQQVNQWVNTNTKGKIKEILNELPSSETKVILTSVLYFKAEWENHFFAGSTRRRPFYANGRKSASTHQADMMSNGGEFPYYKDPDLGCEILGLPYKGNSTTMFVVMPFMSSKETLLDFEQKLTEEDLERLVSKTKMTGTVILFPKMKIEGGFDLRKPLELLGVRSLFDSHQANLALLSPGEFSYRTESGASAATVLETGGNKIKTSSQRNQLYDDPLITQLNFTNRGSEQAVPEIGSRSSITLDNIRQLLNQQSTDNHYQNPGLYADQIVHKVYIDITEKGTEAAAATSVSLSRDGSRVTFRVDVPFFFFIRHEETKTILFWGSVLVPSPNYYPSD